MGKIIFLVKILAELLHEAARTECNRSVQMVPNIIDV